MQCCNFCSWVVCSECLPLPANALDEATFKCPHCFTHTEDGRQMAPVPYTITVCSSLSIFAFLHTTQGLLGLDISLVVNALFTQHKFMPHCNSSPLLILTIKLVSISATGLPPNIIYEHLNTYLPNDIMHTCISFNLSTLQGLQIYQGRIKEFVISVEHGGLAKCEYIQLSDLLLT
jgi:hypothetical protein